MGNFLYQSTDAPVEWPDRLDKTLTRWPSNKEKMAAMEAEIKELRKMRVHLLKCVDYYRNKSNDWYKKARSLDQKVKESAKKKAASPERRAVVEQPSSLTQWIGGSPFH